MGTADKCSSSVSLVLPHQRLPILLFIRKINKMMKLLIFLDKKLMDSTPSKPKVTRKRRVKNL